MFHIIFHHKKYGEHKKGFEDSRVQGVEVSRSQGFPVQFNPAQGSGMFHGIFDKGSRVRVK